MYIILYKNNFVNSFPILKVRTYEKNTYKEPKVLSNHIIVFANAYGSTLVMGIVDNKEITGIMGLREMKKTGLPAPEYKSIAFMLHATIRNRINVADHVVDNVADHVVDISNLSATEQAILKYLQASPALSAKELGTLLHRSSRTIQRNINTLKEKGIIQREGSDRSGKWIIQGKRL